MKNVVLLLIAIPFFSACGATLQSAEVTPDGYTTEITGGYPHHGSWKTSSPETVTTVVFEYSGDLTESSVKCRNWVVYKHDGAFDTTVSFAKAGTTNIATMDVPADEINCKVSGLDQKGNTRNIFNKIGQSEWEFRDGNYMTVNGYVFPKTICYYAGDTKQNEFSVDVTGNISILKPTDNICYNFD